MKRFALAGFGLATLGAVALAAGDDVRALLRERAEGGRSVRARFTQVKHLRILRDVLTSTGTVTVDRDRKVVVWEIDAPETARVVLRGDGLWVDGKKQAEAGGPWPETVAALLTGVSPELERDFEIHLAEEHRLRLEPRSERLAEYVASIDLVLEPGRAVPRRIRWVEPEGDETVLELDDVELDPKIEPEDLAP